MESKLFLFAYREVFAIAPRIVDGYAPSFIKYLWKHVLLIRKRRTKGGPFPFAYREVFAIALRRVGGYSLSLIECLCSYVSLI